MNATNTCEQENGYVSYFQSVTTIGIITSANNIENAEIIANKKFDSQDGLCYCLFDQTPFHLTDTEPYNPELLPGSCEEGVSIRFNPNKDTSELIARKIGKDINTLSNQDIEDFVKKSIHDNLRD